MSKGIINFFLIFFLTLGNNTHNFQSIGKLENQDIPDPFVDYVFGEYILFDLSISKSVEIDSVQSLFISILPKGQDPLLEEVFLDEGGRGIFYLDTQLHPIKPFAEIQFFYRMFFQDGEEQQSDIFSFIYEDNRFDWVYLEDDQFQVFWYDGDLNLGQTILNVANSGLYSAQTYLPADHEFPIRIYAFENANDLQTSLLLTQEEWVAGHASPELGVILISAPAGPGQRFELERQIPHEIAHILEYEMVAEDYYKIPIWFTEGIASISEIYPNPEYQRILTYAAEEGTLLPLDSLCLSFPGDTTGAFQAYAQSASFTRFLYKKYGSTGLQSLLGFYQDGFGCDEGFQASFGAPIAQLENRWQQEVLGINPVFLVLRNLSPYFIILLILLFMPLSPYFLDLLRTKK
ncbi:MAG: peptidase MA family metallohydrolase [Anaerolineaceae bacterium]|nr:peptidase MA family metallohydrolase [Anaerolineaceae bacterium]